MRNENRDMSPTLGDFTATPRLISISSVAIAIGLVSAFVALGLLRLIGFFTNVFFYQRLSAALVSPEGHHLGFPDESLRIVVSRMAETGLTRFPVVERGTEKLVGMIALTDLLKARSVNLDAEQRRERVLDIRIAMPFGQRSRSA